MPSPETSRIERSEPTVEQPAQAAEHKPRQVDEVDLASRAYEMLSDWEKGLINANVDTDPDDFADELAKKNVLESRRIILTAIQKIRHEYRPEPNLDSRQAPEQEQETSELNKQELLAKLGFQEDKITYTRKFKSGDAYETSERVSYPKPDSELRNIMRRHQTWKTGLDSVKKAYGEALEQLRMQGQEPEPNMVIKLAYPNYWQAREILERIGDELQKKNPEQLIGIYVAVSKDEEAKGNGLILYRTKPKPGNPIKLILKKHHNDEPPPLDMVIYSLPVSTADTVTVTKKQRAAA
ncbi:MAG: hypothetical protein A3H70_00530 [Candidatus Komeilibacteria bacterium RIFCSPLOWO2_02_FULL_48_11]|uniref:Uncharacterized protein n=1 Tax=Candidatus Komeilibacteria bacterium RIFCSPLOWO2_02_FULL_48_11 TaxID=1798553 RepID=A0A1G2BRP9_9BACT|nr:MAG: hypothetical protein A3H70_00530 [Candidatus Komeilibacteria bacterium RIFCSPLOWO2_02_FULL_48_11]